MIVDKDRGSFANMARIFWFWKFFTGKRHGLSPQVLDQRRARSMVS
jgi:hypothetical protein